MRDPGGMPMGHETGSKPRAVLDPLDRSSDVLFVLGVALSTIAIQLGG